VKAEVAVVGDTLCTKTPLGLASSEMGPILGWPDMSTPWYF